eukprot:6018829-Prymnesium_polylepis.1
MDPGRGQPDAVRRRRRPPGARRLCACTALGERDVARKRGWVPGSGSVVFTQTLITDAETQH